MEKVSTEDVVKNTILRMIVVICSTAGFGLAFFRLNVFDLRMFASQFLTSGVTAAIIYAALKTPRWRDGFAGLLVWYLVLTFLVGEYQSWLPILYFAYVAGIAAAVSLYSYFVRKDIVRGVVQRVAAAGVITAVANAVIILFLGFFVFLGFFQWNAVFASRGFFASTVFRNLQVGTLVGIGFGLGVEIAEYLIRRMEGGKVSESGLPPVRPGPEVAWAVEYVENDQRIVSLDPIRHSTPEEAKRAFEDSRGIPWKELERRGAKIVQQEVPSISQITHGS